MLEISNFNFNTKGAEDIKNHRYGKDWPVVYLIENGKKIYIGETTRAHSRTKQHLENPNRKNLKKIHIIFDDEFNKSAALDTESSLIEYIAADGNFEVLNSNKGLQNHSYFNRELYKAKFTETWEHLREKKLVINKLIDLENSNLFKFSPFKTLNEDQYGVANSILKIIEKDKTSINIIQGGAGTGKTILAIYLLKYLVSEKELSVGLVVAMSSLRKTLQKVFTSIPGLKSSMVIAPNQVTKTKYDVLIVDEAHRLRQRRNLTNYKVFDQTNQALNLPKEATELDWVQTSAPHVILFYDEKQRVRPSDVDKNSFKITNSNYFTLAAQMRILGGNRYTHFIHQLLNEKKPGTESFEAYDFRLFTNIENMVSELKKREHEHGLSRLVAGYAWEWKSRANSLEPDIQIDNTKLFWNSETKNWINSSNSINEVGCIHTIQGYDLNYAGVIIGPDLSYDPIQKKLIINKKEYKDTNGHRGVIDPEELRQYIINIYMTLLTRGIKGTYVYIVDTNLREYFQKNTPEIYQERD